MQIKGGISTNEVPLFFLKNLNRYDSTIHKIRKFKIITTIYFLTNTKYNFLFDEI